MTKDGVRDFIAAEYTLSENYVHGLAAFGPRLKNFESPHSSRGSSPGLPAGNSVNGGRRPGQRESPDFARQMLSAAGLNCVVEGSGTVQAQSAEPGSSVQRGTIITLTCG